MKNLYFLFVMCLFSKYYCQTPNMVKDSYPGINSGLIPGTSLKAINNGVIYPASTNSPNIKILHYSDGSLLNTNPLIPTLTFNLWLSNVGSNYLFAANDGTSGVELWRTDGTGGNTNLLLDINTGSASSLPTLLCKTPNKIYFTASSSLGRELWVSDGTVGGTFLLRDIFVGPNSSTISASYNINGDNIYFLADEGVSGNELWFSDGTVAGTVSMGDIFVGGGSAFPTNNLSYISMNGNQIFFTAVSGTNGKELWTSNGTQAGTYLVKDIFPGTASSNPAFLGFTNNTLFFTCDNGSIGRELWRSDGTLAGTFLLIELNPGSGSCNIKENTTFQNNFIFRHTLSAMPVNDHVLWQSDGTLANTFSVSIAAFNKYDIYTNSIVNSNFFQFNNELYFASLKEIASVNQDTLRLHKITGSISTNTLVKTILLSVKSPTNPSFLIIKPQGSGYFNIIMNIYFAGYPDRYFKVYTSDGTSSGTNLISQLIQYHGWQSITPVVYNPLPALPGTNDVLAFCTPSFTNNSYPCRIDLASGNITSLGTSISYPNCYGMGSLNPFRTAIVGNKLYFVAEANGQGIEVAETDGTPGGTNLTLDINPGSASCFSTSPEADLFIPTVSAGKMYFTANDNLNGTELWSLGTGNASIKKINKETDFIELFPNPTENEFILKSHGVLMWSVSIYNSIGDKIIEYENINSFTQEINLQGISSGIYFVCIDANKQKITKKLIVK